MLPNFQAMARYNRWMNERIYEHCAKLTDADRKRDRGAYFRSIHGTLNHLLLGDRLWLGRFLAREFRLKTLADELYSAAWCAAATIPFHCGSRCSNSSITRRTTADRSPRSSCRRASIRG